MIISAKDNNSVTPLFYKGVPTIAGDAGIIQPFYLLKEFADVSMEAVYVLDFLKRGFHFVANRDFFLCGHSVEEVLSLGYDFFPEVIHSKDLTLLAEIHANILQRLFTMDKLVEINCFSFSVRFKNELGNIMVNHKMKPVIIDGQIRFGLCLLESSVLEKPGNLRAYYNNSTSYDEYSTKDGKWVKKTIQPFTKREREVLIWAKQGKTNEQIAVILNVEHQTIRNIEHAIYQKLYVNSMIQAIIVDANHHQFMFQSYIHNSRKQEKTPKAKQLRRPITSEKLLFIQDSLNKGKSVNSISKQMNISESAIRYHIDKGHLIKNKIVRESINEIRK